MCALGSAPRLELWEARAAGVADLPSARRGVARRASAAALLQTAAREQDQPRGSRSGFVLSDPGSQHREPACRRRRLFQLHPSRQSVLRARASILTPFRAPVSMHRYVLTARGCSEAWKRTRATRSADKARRVRRSSVRTCVDAARAFAAAARRGAVQACMLRASRALWRPLGRRLAPRAGTRRAHPAPCSLASAPSRHTFVGSCSTC
jgi:hypothetical protein